MNRTQRETRPHTAVQMIVALICTMSYGLAVEAAGPKDRVVVVAAPDGGIQPQAVVDDAGSVHLIYFKGDPAAGDLFYVRSAPGTTEFSKAIQVNTQSGSAIAVGTIRGGQMALGRSGQVHVAWNGSQNASPPNPIKGTPMLYARRNQNGSAFERQRNLMHKSFYLDGGGSIGADKAGNVYVAWHATSTDAQPGEAGRKLWIARSSDDGATFAEEEPALADAIGACACCGTKALVDRRGALYVLYRAATRNVERDMMLVTSRDQGQTLQGKLAPTLASQHVPDELGVAFRYTLGRHRGMGNEGADCVCACRSRIARTVAANLAPRRRESEASGPRRQRRRRNDPRVGGGHRLEARRLARLADLRSIGPSNSRNGTRDGWYPRLGAAVRCCTRGWEIPNLPLSSKVWCATRWNRVCCHRHTRCASVAKPLVTPAVTACGVCLLRGNVLARDLGSKEQYSGALLARS